MIAEHKPVDDDKVRLKAETSRPLAGIEQTEDEWLLGHMHVGKHSADGGTSWRVAFSRTSRFYKRVTPLADGAQVVAVVLRICDENDPPGQKQIEHLAGWVPSECESEADQWIAFLNEEIAQRLAGVPTTRQPPHRTPA